MLQHIIVDWNATRVRGSWQHGAWYPLGVSVSRGGPCWANHIYLLAFTPVGNGDDTRVVLVVGLLCRLEPLVAWRQHVLRVATTTATWQPNSEKFIYCEPTEISPLIKWSSDHAGIFGNELADQHDTGRDLCTFLIRNLAARLSYLRFRRQVSLLIAIRII